MMLQGKSEFISIGCNRVPGCLATMKYCQKLKGLFAYGANHVIALGWPAISCDFQTCHSSDIPLEATISSSGIQRTLNGHSSRVNQVKFVDTNKEKFSFSGLVSACAAGELIFWKLESTDRTFSSVVPNARIQAHAGGIECLDLMILDTGRVLVLTAGADETVKTWLLTEAESGIQWTLLQEIKLSSVLATTLSLSGPLKMECGTEYAILAIATTNNQVQMYSSLLKEPRGTLFNFLGNAQGHEGWVRTIDFTFQKGQLIMATGSMDKYIRIWRVQSKFEDNRIQCQFTMISLLIGHDAWIYNVKFLQQSEDAYVRLLSSSADGSILLWQSTVFSDDVFCMGEISWNTIGTMGELSDTFGFYGLDYYVDAEHTVIISHSHSGSLHLFLVLSNLKCTIQNCLGFTGHIGAVRHVAWQKMSSGEYVLASVSDDCTTRLYIQRKKELDKSKNLKSQIPIGRWLEVARPQIHGYEMRAISFLPLNQGNLQFVSAGDEKVVRVFEGTKQVMKTIGVINNWRDEELENLLKNIKIESSDVAPLGLSNKNRSEYLPVSREDSTKPESESSQLDSINESNLLSRISENWLSSRTLFPEVEKLYGHPFEIYSLAIHPSAKFLVATCKSLQKESSQLKFWRTIDWRPFQPLPLIERMIHTSTITCVQFSKKGHWLVATSRDRSFTLYKVNFTDDDSVILQLVWHQKAAHSRIIWTVDFVNLHCQDGECPLFVTGGRDNKLKMWQYFSDRGQGNLIHSLDFESSITALITLPSPPHSEKAAVCIGFESGHLCRVNISSNSATTSQGLHSNSQTSCCTSDEKRIFEEPQKIADYLCPSGSVLYLAAAVRQEGVLLAVASEDFSLRVISF